MNYQIILFLPSFESGGVERNAVYFANGIVEGGLDVHLLYCRKIDSWFSRLDPRINKVSIPRWFRFPHTHERVVDAVNMLLFSIFKIIRIRRTGPTAIVSFQSNVIAILLARLCRVPIAVRLSNHFNAIAYEKSFLRKVAEFGKRHSYGLADVVIANSSELASEYGLLLKREVETIPNPVDIEKIRWLKEKELDESIFLRKQNPIIISAGRLTPQKNFQLLLRAMADVVKEISCSLVILGEGNDRESLEQLADDLKLGGIVHFFGYRKNVYKYFQCADLFVLSSNYEGMPNVVIEAIACGLPVVATRCKTGPTEILCDGEGGELVPVNDQQALANAIIRSIKEPLLTEKKRLVAINNLINYSSINVNKKYIALVNKLIGNESKQNMYCE